MEILKKSRRFFASNKNRFVGTCSVIVGTLLMMHMILYHRTVYHTNEKALEFLNFETFEHITFKPVNLTLTDLIRRYDEAEQKQVVTSKMKSSKNLSSSAKTTSQIKTTYSFTEHMKNISEGRIIISNNKSSKEFSNKSYVPRNLQSCPKTPPGLVGPLPTYLDWPSFKKLEELHPELSPGGRYKPPDCISRHKVAIIIPYRNREEQLRTFLKNIHPFLQRQQLNYGIYVVEQEKSLTFNKALMMNIGFTEASKLYDYQCFVFHDVDLIPQDDRNIYSCPNQPKHLTAAIDKYNYRLAYRNSIGGAVVMTKQQFQKVNGYSNKYFGWGGEDDDMWNRVISKGYKVIRNSLKIARYTMIKHVRDKGNEKNPGRFELIKNGTQRLATDGLNTLKYKVLKQEYRKLYTRILVSLDEKEIMKITHCMTFLLVQFISRIPDLVLFAVR